MLRYGFRCLRSGRPFIAFIKPFLTPGPDTEPDTDPEPDAEREKEPETVQSPVPLEGMVEAVLSLVCA